MEGVNALKIRNSLGEIIGRLNQKVEPILISLFSGRGDVCGWAR